MRLLLCLRNYVESPDPLANIANSIGVLIAANLPGCALFSYAAAGVRGWTAWAVLIAVPFFAFVPAMTRRHSLAGRTMLPLVGIVTVLFYVKLFGVGSAVELFLFPCVLLGTTLFRTGERWMAVPVLGLAFLVYWFNRYSEPLQSLTLEGQTAFVAINAFSVAVLIALNGLMLSKILLERRV
jgi:hypothetical protein